MARGLAAISQNANAATDMRVGGFRHPCRCFVPVMRAARSLWRNKVAEEIAAISGRSVRTAERWLSGEVTPDGEATLALAFSEVGPLLIEAGVAALPPERQEAFWEEIARAAKRADLRRRRAALEREEKLHGL